MFAPSGRLLSAVVIAVFLASSCGEALHKDQQACHIVRDCMSQLEALGSDTEMKREGFVSLVQALSGGVHRGSYEQLPLQYKAMFNMNACLNGKDCVRDHATISISSQDERKLICSSIASVLSQSTTLSDSPADSSRNETSSTCPVDIVDKATMGETEAASGV